jgi:hypothetical protein
MKLPMSAILVAIACAGAGTVAGDRLAVRPRAALPPFAEVSPLPACLPRRVDPPVRLAGEAFSHGYRHERAYLYANVLARDRRCAAREVIRLTAAPTPPQGPARPIAS